MSEKKESKVMSKRRGRSALSDKNSPTPVTPSALPSLDTVSLPIILLEDCMSPTSSPTKKSPAKNIEDSKSLASSKVKVEGTGRVTRQCSAKSRDTIPLPVAVSEDCRSSATTGAIPVIDLENPEPSTSSGVKVEDTSTVLPEEMTSHSTITSENIPHEYRLRSRTTTSENAPNVEKTAKKITIAQKKAPVASSGLTTKSHSSQLLELVKNFIPIGERDSIPSNLSAPSCSTENKQDEPPVIPATRIRSIKKEHELIFQRFKVATERLKTPDFPSESIEPQKLLITLFLHLLEEIGTFMVFLEGKEDVERLDEATGSSDTTKMQKLASVREDFISELEVARIHDLIEECQSKFQEISSETEFKVLSCRSADEQDLPAFGTLTELFMNSSIPFQPMPRIDKVSKEWLDYIVKLNEEVQSLLCSCRDTARAIVDYCYQIKLSTKYPLLPDYCKVLLREAAKFLQLREVYVKSNPSSKRKKMILCDVLKLKLTIALELKATCLSLLEKNSRFWDRP